MTYVSSNMEKFTTHIYHTLKMLSQTKKYIIKVFQFLVIMDNFEYYDTYELPLRIIYTFFVFYIFIKIMYTFAYVIVIITIWFL